ncbi:unnamed protein product [Chrysodeixis includens]|uniref:Uncharacterized protein n=1 Tax=Chrysodeixis includens TaxID=689277 RepID=A0A9N8PZV3_CHRIL|nr:unnamed protein product [Chrysodeixis includens]
MPPCIFIGVIVSYHIVPTLDHGQRYSTPRTPYNPVPYACAPQDQGASGDLGSVNKGPVLCALGPLWTPQAQRGTFLKRHHVDLAQSSRGLTSRRQICAIPRPTSTSAPPAACRRRRLVPKNARPRDELL